MLGWPEASYVVATVRTRSGSSSVGLRRRWS